MNCADFFKHWSGNMTTMFIYLVPAVALFIISIVKVINKKKASDDKKSVSREGTQPTQVVNAEADPYLARQYTIKAIGSGVMIAVGIAWYLFGRISGYASADGWSKQYITYVIGCMAVCFPLALSLILESKKMSYEDQTIYGEVSNNKITLKSNRTVQFLIYLLFSAIICYVIAPIALIVITVFRAGKVIYCLTQIRKYKSTSTRRISAQPARFGAPSSPNDTKDKDEKRYRVSKKDAERYLDPANKDDLVIPWDETHTYAFKKICIYHSRCKQTDYRNYILTEPRDNEFPTASCIFYVEYDHKGKPYIICDNKNLYYFDIDYDFKQAEKDATWYQLSENDAKTAKGTPPFYMHLKDENGKIRDAFCHGVVSGADLSVILAQDFYLVSIIDYYASAFDEKNEENMQVYTLQRDVCGIYGSTESIYSYLCRDEKI